MQVLFTRSDYKIKVQHEDNYFEATDQFTVSEHGFMIAAALTGYDGKSVDDPAYGQLKFYSKNWVSGYTYGETQDD